MNSDVQRVRRFEVLGLQSGIRIHKKWAEANKATSEVASQHSDVSFLKLSGDALFKTMPFCQSTLSYHDSHQLNDLGAKLYGKVAAGASEE